MRSDLEAVTGAPRGRDPTHHSYGKIARWVAGRLQEQGVLPAGDGRSRLKRYLQTFEWDQRFAPGRGRSDNVIGIRPGDGSTREAILVIAHLDGLSGAQKRTIEAAAARSGKPLDMSRYQGANDNGSAVAAALHVSDALRRLERLKGRPLSRDVVFFFPSAEEEGLKGTEAFTRFARHFGDKRFVAAINFEMVGRGNPARIRLFGGNNAADALRNPVYRRAMALPTRGAMARLIPGHEHDGGERWFTRSDHYVTALGGVPSVMYVGEPGDYHRPADNLASIDVRTNRAVSRHATRLVVDLANAASPAPSGRPLPFKVRTGYGGKVYRP